MQDRQCGKFWRGVIGLVLGLGLSSPAAAQEFVHPGVMHTSADLDRMRDRVAAGEEPYVTGWNRLRTDGHAATNITPRPQAAVQRIPDAGSWDALMFDVHAAQLHAIAWVITGDEVHATKAVEIMNAWSSTLTSFPSTGDPILSSATTGLHLAAAAEVIRATYPVWSASDQERMRALLVDVFYPPNHNFLIYHEPDGLVHTNTGVNQHFYASWDAMAMATIAAIGVFADDRAIYQEAVDAFTDGTGNGNIMRAVFDGTTGQLQESSASARPPVGMYPRPSPWPPPPPRADPPPLAPPWQRMTPPLRARRMRLPPMRVGFLRWLRQTPADAVVLPRGGAHHGLVRH